MKSAIGRHSTPSITRQTICGSTFGMNRATSRIARRPAGSSIKPIAVYAPAMDLGLITPDTRFEDEADIVLAGKPNWLPYNDDRKNRGVVTIRQAVVSSLNVISAQVLDMMGPQTSYDFLTQKLNVTSLEEADCDYAPLALGQLTTGITVREMAAAYCIFPNKGIYTEPRTFTKICDSDGKVIYENKTDSHAAISETTAYWMTDILQNAVNSGTGTEARIKGMSVAGKTGTTTSKKDRWFCGFTPYYTAAVWTGYDKPEKINVSGNPAAQLWKKVMSSIHEGLEDTGFTKPSDCKVSVVALDTVTVEGLDARYVDSVEAKKPNDNTTKGATKWTLKQNKATSYTRTLWYYGKGDAPGADPADHYLITSKDGLYYTFSLSVNDCNAAFDIYRSDGVY